jgi:HNH endonuclease
MDKALEQAVRRRAQGLCEYCLFPETASTAKHVIDHIIARQHGGPTAPGNLALCCGRCNLYKGPNIAGRDPLTGNLTRLFHPRTDSWGDHFRWHGSILTGVTLVGRTTVMVLGVNKPYRVAARQALIDVGKFPGN